MKLSPLPRPKQSKFDPKPQGDIIRMGEWVKLIGEVRKAELPEGFYSLNEYVKSIGGKYTKTRKTLQLLVKKKLAVMRVLLSRDTARSVAHWRINDNVLSAIKNDKSLPAKE